MGSKRGEMGKREAHAPDRLSSFCGISHVVAVFFFQSSPDVTFRTFQSFRDGHLDRHDP